MKQVKVYSAKIKGTFTLVKADKKANAVKTFKLLDSSIKASDVDLLSFKNSKEWPVEDWLFFKLT